MPHNVLTHNCKTNVKQLHVNKTWNMFYHTRDLAAQEKYVVSVAFVLNKFRHKEFNSTEFLIF